jgi:beta-N-acetylhexosaminidase
VGAAGKEAALAAVERDALSSGREIRTLGVTVNLAPVAEVLSAENKPFLETRSYGPDPEFVEEAAAAFIRGMETAGVACVIKHFPGNTGDDPHLNAATLGGSRDSLAEKVRPMAALFAIPKVPMVMVSHVMIPAWDKNRGASLSGVVIREWLRGELGFKGLVLADDFSMAAAAASGLSPEAAAAEALIAGVDMVMAWPGNLRSVHRAILAALQGGSLSRERLEEAAARILYAKILMGIIPIEKEFPQ